MKKPAAKPKPVAKPKPAPVRKPAPQPTEHRIAVGGVGVSVTYGKSRAETFELTGTATLNAGDAEVIVRTTGFCAFVAGRGANRIAYTPAALGRNMVLIVHADASDLALLREIFVTGTGTEASDPGLTIWAKTARPLKTDMPDDAPVTEFGFRLDFSAASRGF
ncbi:hypothetical protein BH10PSE9_BH10PSE9_13020 [soil metagenome]